MQRLDGYVHRTGSHSGSAALRNLAEFYEWEFVEHLDEAACFGLGAGLGFARFESDAHEGESFVGRRPRMEQLFLEHLGIAYAVHEGETFERAWADVTRRLDAQDPVLLALDPGALDGVDREERFVPYFALAVGYGEEGVLLSDAASEDLRTLSLDDLREAWTTERAPFGRHVHLTVTDPNPSADLETAASRALRETVDFNLDPMTSPHKHGEPDHYGVPGIRNFAAAVESWADHETPEPAARAAVDAIERRGAAGGAFRGRFAASLEFVAPRTAVGGGIVSRVDDIADDWAAVADTLREAIEATDDAVRRERFSEAGSRLAGIAEAEEQLLQHVREELG